MRDAVRDRWLATQGLRVLRYTARDVLSNPEGVTDQIMWIAVDRLGRSQA